MRRRYTAVELLNGEMRARVPPGHGRSWNLGRPFSRPGKSWKITKGPGIFTEAARAQEQRMDSLDCCDICKYV